MLAGWPSGTTQFLRHSLESSLTLPRVSAPLEISFYRNRRITRLCRSANHCGQALSDKSITLCNSARLAPPADCTDIPCITAITYRAKSPGSAPAGKSRSTFARSNRSRNSASPVARREISSLRIGAASSPQASAPWTIKHPFGFPGHESKSAVPTINRSATARAVGSLSASAV